VPEVGRIKMNWISVKDRLPNPSDFVIVCVLHPSGNGYSRVPVTARFEDNEWTAVNWMNGTVVDSVTHWMPLPNPPAKP
jgi:hypothetical protein